MKIYSFDSSIANSRLKRDPKQETLFDVFQKNIVNNQTIPLNVYIVPREFEMRLDRISEYIYGVPDYVEELMTLNNIISPYSVKEGQYIYYCDVNYLYNLYTRDELSDQNEIKRQELMKASKPKREVTAGDKNKLLAPTIKPSGLEQIKVGNDNSVQIINTFE